MELETYLLTFFGKVWQKQGLGSSHDSTPFEPMTPVMTPVAEHLGKIFDLGLEGDHNKFRINSG